MRGGGFSLKKGREAVGEAQDEEPGDEHAREDGGQGLPQRHVQKGGGQRAGPGSGAGQGHRYKKHEPQIFVFRHLPALQVGLGLQPVHQMVQPGQAAAHPLKNAPDIDDDEGGGQDVPHHGGQIGGPIGQPQGHAEGEPAPQLHHRHHGHQGGKDHLAQLIVLQPL